MRSPLLIGLVILTAVAGARSDNKQVGSARPADAEVGFAVCSQDETTRAVQIEQVDTSEDEYVNDATKRDGLHVTWYETGEKWSEGHYTDGQLEGLFTNWYKNGHKRSAVEWKDAELATAMPKAGSDYYFITRSVGAGVGTVAGVLNGVSFSLKSALALVGIGALVRLLAPIDMRLTGAVIGAAFVGMNLVGVRETARLQAALVFVLSHNRHHCAYNSETHALSNRRQVHMENLGVDDHGHA
jgi:hypothetical protein